MNSQSGTTPLSGPPFFLYTFPFTFPCKETPHQGPLLFQDHIFLRNSQSGTTPLSGPPFFFLYTFPFTFPCKETPHQGPLLFQDHIFLRNSQSGTTPLSRPHFFLTPFPSHFQWDFLAYCPRPVSVHLAVACISCSFDSFSIFLLSLKQHQNLMKIMFSCIHFPIWPYPPPPHPPKKTHWKLIL